MRARFRQESHDCFVTARPAARWTAATTAGALAGCGRGATNALAGFVSPDGSQVRAAEERRRPGSVRDFQITPTPSRVDLGGLTAATWTYGGQLPGKPIVVKAGEVVRATLTNRLPQPTTIHWHGLALRNDAGGVPGVTQPLDGGHGRHGHGRPRPHERRE